MAGALIIGVLAHLAKATFLGNLAIVVALIATLNRFVLTLLPFVSRKVRWYDWKDFYNRTISYALKGYRPVWFFLGTVLLFLGSCASLGIIPPKVIYFPEGDPTYVNVFIAAPLGTDIQKKMR